MKLSKNQLERLENILIERGYHKDNVSQHNEDFSYYKTIHRQKDDDHETKYAVIVNIPFWDFSKYDKYQPKNFPIGFAGYIIIVDDTRGSDFHYHYLEDESESIFSTFNPDAKDFKWYEERTPSAEEINDLIDNLEDIAMETSTFYIKTLRERLFKNLRKS
ncbi:MAG: hypothetical protein J1F35_08705 [Erysipelotrichales bacterium]|nr:hypothetical protein [Erysipelotrichales bacterium]